MSIRAGPGVPAKGGHLSQVTQTAACGRSQHLSLSSGTDVRGSGGATQASCTGPRSSARPHLSGMTSWIRSNLPRQKVSYLDLPVRAQHGETRARPSPSSHELQRHDPQIGWAGCNMPPCSQMACMPRPCRPCLTHTHVRRASALPR